MREIKFRAWDKVRNKMVYLNQSGLLYTPEQWGYNEEEYTLLFTSGDTCQPRYKTDAVLMQYTGLLDRTLKDIYLGDIVRLFGINYEVVFECGAFMLATQKTIDYGKLSSKIAEYTSCDNNPYFCMNDNVVSLWEVYWNFNEEENVMYCCEVIGNIHDNPELLTK